MLLLSSLPPKKTEVVDIKDFCPLSLVGHVYKTISKVLARNLKLVLEKIISDSISFCQGMIYLGPKSYLPTNALMLGSNQTFLTLDVEEMGFGGE